MEHSFNGPSTLIRRLLCPGSYHAEKGQPDVPSHDAQADGASWHDETAAAILLQLNGQISSFDDEVLEAMKAFEAEYGQLEALPEVLVEQKLTFKAIPECEVGTPDVVIVNPFDRATIIDWKFTHNDPEPAEGNLQLLAYAIEIAQQYELREVKVVLACILSGKISSYTYDADYLRKGKARIQKILSASMREDAPRVVGAKQCRYCRAALTCLKPLDIPMEENVDDAGVTGIHPEDLAAMADKADIISIWVKRVKDEITSRLKNGLPLPGWEWGEGRMTRRWIHNENEPEAIRLLTDVLGVGHEEVCTLKIKSPAQVEKMFGKEKVAHLIVGTRPKRAKKVGENED